MIIRVLPAEIGAYIISYQLSVHRANDLWIVYNASMKERHEYLCEAISRLVLRIHQEAKAASDNNQPTN